MLQLAHGSYMQPLHRPGRSTRRPRRRGLRFGEISLTLMKLTTPPNIALTRTISTLTGARATATNHEAAIRCLRQKLSWKNLGRSTSRLTSRISTGLNMLTRIVLASATVARPMVRSRVRPFIIVFPPKKPYSAWFSLEIIWVLRERVNVDDLSANLIRCFEKWRTIEQTHES